MTYNLYCIRDNKSAFMQPQVDINHKTAVRNFELTLATVSGDSVMGFAPEDFDLYYIGTFDNETGCVFPVKVPELISSGGRPAPSL